MHVGHADLPRVETRISHKGHECDIIKCSQKWRAQGPLTFQSLRPLCPLFVCFLACLTCECDDGSGGFAQEQKENEERESSHTPSHSHTTPCCVRNLHFDIPPSTTGKHAHESKLPLHPWIPIRKCASPFGESGRVQEGVWLRVRPISTGSEIYHHSSVYSPTHPLVPSLQTTR